MNFWTQFRQIFSDAIRLLAERFNFLGGHKWAVAIILLTIIVRTLLLPLAIKQIRSMQAMQRLQPEIKRLQQKHKKDKQKLNQEMMELYKREGVNPLAGCLPLVAQMPVLFAMYYAIRQITQPTTEWLVAQGIKGATGGEGVTNMPFLGLANACAKETLKISGKVLHVTHCGLAAPTIKTVAGVILLVVMTATSYLTTRQMSANQTPEQARIAQLMPLFFVFIMIRFPAALVLYWTTQNVYQYLQQTLMLRKKVIQSPGGGPKPSRPKPSRPKPKPKR
jgi:YidC/Oxa1 family membrane protein insertase